MGLSTDFAAYTNWKRTRVKLQPDAGFIKLNVKSDHD